MRVYRIREMMLHCAAPEKIPRPEAAAARRKPGRRAGHNDHAATPGQRVILAAAVELCCLSGGPVHGGLIAARARTPPTAARNAIRALKAKGVLTCAGVRRGYWPAGLDPATGDYADTEAGRVLRTILKG
jgi:hypothetical protein